ncbi:MAG: hypothetical protein HKP48_07350 [Winogradskyella sp.]|uniref:hypothetical protein n=1 Tax=Winogradskyella sp. TaxID=1883156 RepID=UPI001832BF38|nr:hypothetical protein [Winogradskyella sp.]MBT8244585.1 hypothetical protein [Winogradskyella sp.]NNK23097.1 hypothetical protein [Winogradskyella sp.]
MKKIITLTLLFIGLLSFAQPPRNSKMRDRIKAQKTAFITEKLELTSDEAQKFWPIYNTYEEMTRKIKADYFKPIRKQMRQNSDISDAKANKFLNQMTEGEDKMHQAKQKLVNDLKTVITSKKIIRLKAAEDEFNKKLLERLRSFREKRNKK